MINQSYTAVVERAEGLEGPFTTEPYEAGWAHEAVVFIKVLRLTAGGRITARVQISPDGVEWANEGASFELINGPGLYFVRLSNFGSWLRVAGAVHTSEASADVTISIALKE